jgi:hypothetical protein
LYDLVDLNTKVIIFEWEMKSERRKV